MNPVPDALTFAPFVGAQVSCSGEVLITSDCTQYMLGGLVEILGILLLSVAFYNMDSMHLPLKRKALMSSSWIEL